MGKFLFVVVLIVIALGVWFSSHSGSSSATSSADAADPAQAAPAPLPSDAFELVFTYGSEKEAWIKDATAAFNAKKLPADGGKHVVVTAIPMGSGDCVDEILNGTRKPHLISPASAAFIRLGNAKARVATGKDLIGATDNLVLSPVVIAMWKPMAEALGYPAKPIGWADILALAREPTGWASKGMPQWGRFRFGHTHPEYSNSGLISLFAEVYAGAGKVAGLTPADVQRPEVGEFVGGIERAVVHYGSSTGFFAQRLFANGPNYLSAAVVYESNVIESYGKNLSFPLVAVYPKEGTFWSDHPIAVVERDWVTSAHRTAAKAYIAFLLDRPQQESALRFGFRPSAVDVAISAPLDAAHGVDPAEPRTTLEVPSVEVMDGAIALWKTRKKPADIALVIDVSGSMDQDGKIAGARAGAARFLESLGNADRISLLTFNNQPTWARQSETVGTARAATIAQVNSLFAGGGTALYDAVAAAHAYLRKNAAPDHITALVVLSDGADTDSTLTLDALTAQLKGGAEGGGVRVFTIAYGKDANQAVLKGIAEASQAKAFAGTTSNIDKVFKDIATFF